MASPIEVSTSLAPSALKQLENSGFYWLVSVVPQRQFTRRASNSLFHISWIHNCSCLTRSAGSVRHEFSKPFVCVNSSCFLCKSVLFHVGHTSVVAVVRKMIPVFTKQTHNFRKGQNFVLKTVFLLPHAVLILSLILLWPTAWLETSFWLLRLQCHWNSKLRIKLIDIFDAVF